MVELREVVRRRRMVRAYGQEPVDPAALERLLDTARRAPSAGFAQGQSFVVVTEAADRRAIAAACREEDYVGRGFDPWISTAPVIVVPCVREADYHERYAEPDKARSRPPDRWPVPYWWVDGGAALMLLLLAAVDEGLGAGFCDIDDRDAVHALLDIPDGVGLLGVVTVGHPAADRPSASLLRGRRPLHTVVHEGRWRS